MEITDIFSYLPRNSASLEELKRIFKDYRLGIHDKVYAVSFGIPVDVCENALMCQKELNDEGKNVAYILKNDEIVAVIGYRE